MICQVTSTQRKSWNIKKTKEKSENVTVPKQLKTNESQNGMFLKPCSYYMNTEVIIFNIRFSITTKLNHEIQEQWHLAPMLVYDSIHPSMSSLLGAFDFPSEKCMPFPKFFSLLESAILVRINLLTFQCLNFQFCSNCPITIRNEQQDIPPCHPRCDND